MGQFLTTEVGVGVWGGFFCNKEGLFAIQRKRVPKTNFSTHYLKSKFFFKKISNSISVGGNFFKFKEKTKISPKIGGG